MNIEQAKKEIVRTLTAYLEKDKMGRYVFPPIRQRPILLIGPPGIGKTAIMDEIAREQGISLVSYTMTHHTRQSAVGLPKISEETFGGENYYVTKYTQSEIIASVYEAMERTGCREGILFLDEINCVSETLAPTMLQLLQNKTFGNHRLPDGWVIVAAGNPPEYNKSVREFDLVTLDRVRQINVDADIVSFLRYAGEHGLHGAVITYLRSKNDRFYLANRQEGQLRYVTARGWEDLSRLLQSYEKHEIPVERELIGEFLCDESTCRDFYSFYCLYRKYGEDYCVSDILRGSDTDRAAREELAAKADFFERAALVDLILNELRKECIHFEHLDRKIKCLYEILKACIESGRTVEVLAEEKRSAFELKRKFRLLSFDEEREMAEVLDRLDEIALGCAHRSGTETVMKTAFDSDLERRACHAELLEKMLEEAFSFVTDCFGDSDELTLFLTRLTAEASVMRFIARFGCPAFLRYSDWLMYSELERIDEKEFT